MKRALALLLSVTIIFFLTGLFVDWLDAEVFPQLEAPTTSQVKLTPEPPPVNYSIADSASAEYARSLGYADWNDYVARRPANKMGVLDDDGANPLLSFQSEALPSERVEDIWFPAVQPLDEPVLPGTIAYDPFFESHRPVFPDTFPDRPLFIASYPPAELRPVYPDHRPDKPAVSVPEPSSLGLIAAGLVALLFRAKLNQ